MARARTTIASSSRAGQGQGDVLEGGFLLAMSEDYDIAMTPKNARTPTIRRSRRCVLLLHEGMTKKSPDRSAEQERVLALDARAISSSTTTKPSWCRSSPVPIRAVRRSKRTSCSGRKPDVNISRFSSHSRRSSADDLLDWRA